MNDGGADACPPGRVRNEKSIRDVGTSRLSATMTFGLCLAAEGDLHYWPGGFWALQNEPERFVQHADAYRIPTRFVEKRTIMALERRGLLERTNGHYEAWRDARRLTEAGRVHEAIRQQQEPC